MAKTTVLFRDVEKTGKTTWKTSYKIWNEEKREWLNKEIYNRFMFREIGFISPTRFDFELGRLINQQMSQKYNRLFKLLEVEYNPLHNIDLTETHTEKHNVESKAESLQDATTSGFTKNETENKNSATQNTNSTETATSETSANSSARSESNAGNITMPDNILSSNEYYNDRQHTNTNNSTDTTGTSKNNATTETTNSGTSEDTIKAISQESKNGTSSSKTDGNVDETWEHTTVTKGSSAGLSFSNAIMQNQKMVEQTNLLKQLFNDLEVLFIASWDDRNLFD